MSYDGPIDPPEYAFTVCINCEASEEDHAIVDLDEGGPRRWTYTVCPGVREVAEAIEADYPFELVYPDSADDTDNSLVIAYENAKDEIFDATFEDDGERDR